MKISVICPMYNEARFVKAWLENVLRFADEVWIGLFDSNDGTYDIIRQYPDSRIKIRQLGKADPYNWQEGKVRNLLTYFCRGKWIMNLDADELLGDEFFDNYDELVNSKEKFIRFMQLPFWYSPNFIRVRQFKKDYWRRFYPSTQIRMFRNENWIRYKEMGNHALLQWYGLGKYSPRLSTDNRTDIPFYHYHFCIEPKENENRNNERLESGIRLETYFGKHPEETKFYSWWNEFGRNQVPVRTSSGLCGVGTNSHGIHSIRQGVTDMVGMGASNHSDSVYGNVG